MPNPVLPRSTAMVAQCDTLTCGTGYVLKSDAASLSCANYPCDVASSDKATCCEGALMCLCVCAHMRVRVRVRACACARVRVRVCLVLCSALLAAARVLSHPVLGT